MGGYKVCSNKEYQKIKLGNIPKEAFRYECCVGKAKDRNGNKSRYNCERYAFLLYAPFDVGSQCCNVMKKNPAHKYAKDTGRKPITGQMADESMQRTQRWLINGCNGFDMKTPVSNPMSFWLEQDVLQYLLQNNIKIASVYGDVVEEDGTEFVRDKDFREIFGFDLAEQKLKTTGCNRTGCMFCGYGCHLEKSPNRFELMKQTHPKQYEWIMKPWSEGGLGYKDVIDWINENGNLKIKY